MPPFKINFTFMVTCVAPNTVVTCNFYFKASSLCLWFETHISQFHYHSVCSCRVFGDKLASVATVSHQNNPKEFLGAAPYALCLT